MIQQIDKENNKWETGKLEYPLGVGINFQIDVTNIDKIYNRLKKSNYKIFVEMEEHWYRKENILMGCREFLVQDPNGYLLRISQDLEDIKVPKLNAETIKAIEDAEKGIGLSKGYTNLDEMWKDLEKED